MQYNVKARSEQLVCEDKEGKKKKRGLFLSFFIKALKFLDNFMDFNLL